jgi:addiction module RelB/DinJ family antitoxin
MYHTSAMLKTTTIRARITPTAQTQAEKILSSLGMTASDAIQLLFYQIQFHRGLPFAVTLPKAETAKILQDSRKGKGVKHHASKKYLYRDLGL